jgi:hypothetical protein
VLPYTIYEQVKYGNIKAAAPPDCRAAANDTANAGEADGGSSRGH